MDNIGKIIKDARIAKGLTQEELGNLVGVQKSAIAKYENGRVVNIKRSTLQGLATVLNLKWQELIIGFNPQMPICKRIQDAMNIRNLKAVDICEKTGIPKSSMSMYLAGKVEPKSDRLYKIAKSLDVSESWLLGYDVPMERTQSQKNNDAISDIVVRLRTDENFLLAVEKIYAFSPDKLASFLHLLD